MFIVLRYTSVSKQIEAPTAVWQREPVWSPTSHFERGSKNTNKREKYEQVTH